MDTKLRRRFLKSSLMAVGSSLVFPAIVRSEKQKYRWKMVTTWPKDFPGLGTAANRLARRIEALTQNQIRIRVFGAGEVVPALSAFDAVSRGTVEMAHGASYYWKGKTPSAPFFAAVPFGFTAQEMDAWMKHGGGQTLWDECYAPFNVRPFPCGNTGVQMGGWYRKEINHPKDLKGLKIRMPGLGGEVLSLLGATVVSLAGGEIFQALKAGTIDATEWIGPYNDLAFGLYKAAPYYYHPGWHEPGSQLECLIQKKLFEELPAHLQIAVESAMQATHSEVLAEFTARNLSALQMLVKTHGIVPRPFPTTVLHAIGEKAQFLLERYRKDPETSRVANSYASFLELLRLGEGVTESAYLAARSDVWRQKK